MTIETKIIDGTGRGFEVNVSSGNALKVYQDTPPLQAVGASNRKRFLKEELTALNVDGSVTPQLFTITADNDADIFVTRIIWVISDGSINLSKYGAIPSLANGSDLFITEQGIQTYLVEEAQTGGQVAVNMGMFSPFGSAANINTVTGWEGNNDALICTLDVSQVMGEGLRIGRGSQDKITVQINDDLTGLTDQFVTFLGYKLYE